MLNQEEKDWRRKSTRETVASVSECLWDAEKMERGEGILGIIDRFNLKQVEWISEKTVDFDVWEMDLCMT